MYFITLVFICQVFDAIIFIMFEIVESLCYNSNYMKYMKNLSFALMMVNNKKNKI